MSTYLWGPEDHLMVPVPSVAFLMHKDDSGMCQMQRVGIPEHQIIQWAKKFGNKKKRFLDCGAHMGSYSLLLADDFKEVNAFEAQRRTYYQLCGNIFLHEKTNVFPFHLALTDKDHASAYAQLNIVSEDGGGSTVLPVQAGQKIIRTEEVETEYIDNLEWNDVGLLKLDVEGNELAVIVGAHETLLESNKPPIIFEANNHEWFAARKRELFSYIISLGYTISELRPFDNMYIAIHQ